MRLPLGILSGMGFIGAGAIVRRGDLVQGVTTAATLWFVTVMGLCFGGGQIGLGLAALALAILVLWPLKWAERWVGHERRGILSITTDAANPIEQVILPRLVAAGFRIGQCAVSLAEHGKTCTLRCDIRWHERHPSRSPVELARELGRDPEIAVVEWQAARTPVIGVIECGRATPLRPAQTPTTPSAARRGGEDAPAW